MPHLPPAPSLRNQRGVALVVAMLVMLALSVLALVMMTSVMTDRRIAGHSQRESAALNTAEAGVAEACSRLRNLDINFNNNPRGVAQIFNCAQGSVPVLGTDSVALATAQTAGSWLRYTTPGRGIGTLTVQYKTDAARTVIYRYDNTKNPPIQTATGMPIYVVTSTGSEGADVRTVVAEVTQKPIQVAVNGAFCAGQDVKFTGTAFACGYNHRADTPEGTTDRTGGAGSCNQNLAASPPLWEWPAGSLAGIWTTGDPGGSGASNATGTPPKSEDNPTFFAGPWEAIGMSQAEFYGWVGPPLGAMPGTPNGIFYLDNNSTKQDALGSWSGNSGSGMLYVDGDLTLNAGFTWRGLMYVEGDIKVNGHAWVLGSVVCKGKTSIKFNGDATVLYSGDAIQQNLTKYGGKFTNLSYFEP